MEKFLKKMFWGSLCLCSALYVCGGFITVGVLALNVGSIISASGFPTYLGVGATTFVTTLAAYASTVFSKRKFNEIDIQFVDKMKKLGKWIKTGVEKVLNLVPGLSRTEDFIIDMTEVIEEGISEVENEPNMDNSIVKNQDVNEIEVEPGTNEVMPPEKNQDKKNIGVGSGTNEVMPPETNQDEENIEVVSNTNKVIIEKADVSNAEGLSKQ